MCGYGEYVLYPRIIVYGYGVAKGLFATSWITDLSYLGSWYAWVEPGGGWKIKKNKKKLYAHTQTHTHIYINFIYHFFYFFL